MHTDMKRTSVFFCFMLFLNMCFSQNTHYYWYHNEQYYLNENLHKHYILVKDIDTAQIKYYLQSNLYEFDNFQEFTNIWRADLGGINYCWTFVRCNNSFDTTGYGKMLEYFAPVYTEPTTGIPVNLSNLFHVKLNSLADTAILKQMANNNGVIVMGHNKYMPLWYTLLCGRNSTQSSLSMANYFYESGHFAAAEPDFMGNNDVCCVSDTYFSDQWGLNNTGQYVNWPGIDIKYCDVQNITKGDNDVIVAIVDRGIDQNHPDLTNHCSISYDTEEDTIPSNLWGWHGTNCAGIIGADANNGIGVAGIAPLCPLMSISNKLNSSISNAEKLANGINFAWKNGASVINNSWSWNVSEMIEDAIDSAVTFGRNGKGAVVVCSSGNDNSSVKFPASLSSVITVGAISPCGQRKSYQSCDQVTDWGSCFGPELDIMAPGVLISTTNLSRITGFEHESPSLDNSIVCPEYSDYKYTRIFGGTSAAAPHVAGVAALMLSVNPNLTQQQVRDILEKTAQKIDTVSYSYKDTTGRPNGKWNNEMGYGLLDAYSAVMHSIYNLYTKDYATDDGSEPGDINQYLYDSPDIWLRRLSDNDTVHQLASNGTNYLNVRVRNKGLGTSMTTDSIRVYYRRAELQNSNNWGSNYWYYGGVAGLPAIPAGDSVIVKIPVTLSTFHPFDNFAFYTRIDSELDTLQIHETAVTRDNINNNNNISAKNTKITSYLISSDNFGLDANFNVPSINSSLTDSKLKLDFSTGTSNILDKAEVTLIFPEDLMTDWTPVSENIKQLTANTFLVTGEIVEFSDIPETDVTFRYNFLTTGNFSENIFKNHITQYVGDDEELVGGLTIQVEKPNRAVNAMFTANAGNDTAILIGTNATLHATQINETATYRWYDKQRNFKYEGLNYTVTPIETSEYILEVTAESDGYRDLDTVKVNVVPGCIRSITPNPVSDNWVTVSYEYASTVTSAHLYIYNTGTTTLVGNYDLSNLDNVGSLDVEVTDYPTGSYTVVLVCDNAVCHSKVLIKQ